MAVAGKSWDTFVAMEALEPRLLLAADPIGVDVIAYAVGGDPVDNGKALPGGKGGTIDIRTGVVVSPGGGEGGWLKTNITLTSGTYDYEQVGESYSTGHWPIITVDGDVTINCVTLFVAEIRAIYRAGSPPPQVYINAGPAIDYYGVVMMARAPTPRRGTSHASAAGHARPAAHPPGVVHTSGKSFTHNRQSTEESCPMWQGGVSDAARLADVPLAVLMHW